MVRGGSKTIIDEVERSMHDALCIVRNLIKDPRVLVGGGATELSMSLHLRQKADEIVSVEQYAIRGFADALEQICVVLAENAGMEPIQSLTEAKSKQLSEDTHVYGIACMEGKVDDMRKQGVFESIVSKRLQV